MIFGTPHVRDPETASQLKRASRLLFGLRSLSGNRQKTLSRRANVIIAPFTLEAKEGRRGADPCGIRGGRGIEGWPAALQCQ